MILLCMENVLCYVEPATSTQLTTTTYTQGLPSELLTLNGSQEFSTGEFIYMGTKLHF